MLEGHDIVCFAPGLWDESWLDVHRYMLLLSQANRVLLIERPVTPISFAVAGQRAFAWQQINRSLRGTIRKIDTNLYVATPPLSLPLRYEDGVLRFNHWILLRWLKKILRDFGISHPILWLYEPNSALLIEALQPKASLYMVTDDYATAPTALNRREKIRQWEHIMLETVALVITSERHLTEARHIVNPNTHTVGHGVDHALFSQALEDSLPIPDIVQHIDKPIIGFMGRINQRIDLEIINAIRSQDWQVVMIGALGEDTTAQRLAQYPDIIFTGYKEQVALPAYLKAIDVCIIPYTIDEHTQHMHPLKALEYLAAGCPVVSTPLPALKEQHSDWIAFATSPSDFVSAIDQALTEDHPEQPAKRSQYAASRTWHQQLDIICDLIEQTIEVSL